VLFEGHQFAYRDAGHFYYPLYHVVQREWEAGRWPLWNPWHNGGRPLLGMPMAAVFYPGKILFALLPYASAYRLYVVAHTTIAWLGMLLFARGLGVSLTGASLAAISYAFGTPVLFLHSNVVFLVGAAWAPWGFLAIHRLLGERRRQAVVELALVLALQVLGGDPEGAYLTFLFGSIYAFVLACNGTEPGSRIVKRRRALLFGVTAGGLLWLGVACGVAFFAPSGVIPDWFLRSNVTWPTILAVVSLLGFWTARDGTPLHRIRPMLAALAGAGLLAAALAAVQLAPACELGAHLKRRATVSATDIYSFSVEPYRLFEAIWPHIYGVEVPVNRSWIQAIPPAGERLIWSPSLYLGALTLVLFLGAAGMRRDQCSRSWLTVVTMLSLIAAFGKFAGPLWWARCVPQLAAVLGQHDAWVSTSRIDGYLSDGAGSAYGILTTLLPGFGLFRYPAKLLVITCLAVSALAGQGWDRLLAGEARTTRRWCLWISSASSIAIVLCLYMRGPIETWVGRYAPSIPVFGPIDPSGALNTTLFALIQAGALCALGWVLIPWVFRHRRVAGALAVVLTTADLALADSRIVWTVPQTALDRTPWIAQLIEQAERFNPSPGPFRIQRVEQWHPVDFLRHRSERRFEQLAVWEHDTLHGLYGELVPLAYTLNPDGIELDEQLEFFEVDVNWRKDGEGLSRPVYSYSRGGFDLWNTRYFVMPIALNGWMGEEQAFTRIYPENDTSGDPEKSRQWIAREGWQLLRNRAAMPRCWIVHSAVPIRPTARGSPQRAEMIRTLIGSSGSRDRDPNAFGSIDLKQTALVETDEPTLLSGLIGHPSTEPSESITITKAEPQSVEIDAKLTRPGLVILGDLYYPGWKLKIDGHPAPILRTNRMMRGAIVAAGKHQLVYDYQPDSFWIGSLVSLAGLAVVGVLYWQLQGGRSQPTQSA
jgi:hypothetical protein